MPVHISTITLATYRSAKFLRISTMMRFASLLILWLPFAMAANSTYTPCTLCVDEASESELEQIKVRLVTGPTVDDYTEVVVGDSLEIFDMLDKNKPTLIFIFGWLGNPNLPSSVAMTEAFIGRGDYNFVILNWSNISPSEYTFAARSVKGVGYTLADKVLNKWAAAGFNISGLHLVGHSLGAQICGYTGRYVNFTLPRITGLDPAGPGFYIMLEHLTYKDATFVEIIHTDAGVLGINLQTGHVDFYANGGTSDQPGCSIGLDACSHFRSVYYFAGSVPFAYEESFVGLACDSEADFEAGRCSSNQTAIMGLDTPRNATGRYYLVTNSAEPYGKGDAGTKASSSDSVIGSIVTAL